MKKFLSILAVAAVFTACSNGNNSTTNSDSTTTTDTTMTTTTPAPAPDTTKMMADTSHMNTMMTDTTTKKVHTEKHHKGSSDTSHSKM